MSEQLIVVDRWRRYGKDRLYVQRSDGTKVGYQDLLDDSVHPESPEDEPTLLEAVETWHAGQGSGGTAQEAEQTSQAPKGETRSAWVRPDEVLGTPVARAPKLVTKAASVVFNAEARAGLHIDEGEDKVAVQLAKVVIKDPRWMLAHVGTMQAGGRCFDHVLVGPGGVFLIGSRLVTHRDVWVRGDTFMVDGTRFPYVTDMRAATETVATTLQRVCGFPVTVTGLLLTVDPHDLTVKDTAPGIEVMARMQAGDWLAKRKPSLPEAEQVAVMDVLLRPTTWTTR